MDWLQSNIVATFLALGFVMGSETRADASWMTIKNNSGKAIVVQECVVVNGQVRRGKPTNLLPGETLREFLPGPTVKRVEVFEAKDPGQAAWSGDLNCKDESQTFSVSVSGGKVTVNPCPAKKK